MLDKLISTFAAIRTYILDIIITKQKNKKV